MALPIIRKLIDSPLPDGDGSFEDSLSAGTFGPATNTRFEVGIPGQVTTVFKCTFTVSGGEVTGGTITGYVTHLGETKVLEASGFSLDAVTTIAAIEAFQGGDFDAYFRTFYANDTAKKLVGSGYADDLYVAGDGSVGLGKAGDDGLFGNTYGITGETLKGEAATTNSGAMAAAICSMAAAATTHSTSVSAISSHPSPGSRISRPAATRSCS